MAPIRDSPSIYSKFFKHMISNKKIEEYISESLRHLIKKSNRRKIYLSSKWINTLPLEPGVYVVFEKGILVYVGETGNIQYRMWDMMNSRQHQLRRNVGRMNFSKMPGYRKASSRKKFPEKLEKKLNRWIQNKFEISTLPVYFGRKELEEYIIEQYKPKYNQKGRRKL